ncbi:MAG: Gfo/Idh/MocA family oxidoreductase [Lentisphaeria bacterium]|nr:Gfo/Idh/MocA family oxidoreductase [Lentisphaeria bacterium]
MKKRVAIVGLGSRSQLFSKAILEEYKDGYELVGLCDLNQTRMNFWNSKFIKDYGQGPFATYAVQDFEKMIQEQRVDIVVVATKDCTHHTYICKAMELGCDIMTEKPLTTHADKCIEILDCRAKTGKDIRVTFNYRYSPRNAKVKELIQRGVIGKVINIHFEWTLDTKHGADYFRRWHRDKSNSGGLLVHKSTHHFDLVNWWLDDQPEEVFAWGQLAFYGRENAEKRGITRFYDRCYGSPNAEGDPFAIDLSSDENLKGLYLDAEHEDGYIRDQSVFGHNISIEDSMSVMVKYKKKTTLNYSLNAFCPWEGYKVSFTGTRGRIELDIIDNAYISGSDVDQNNPDHNMQEIANQGKLLDVNKASETLRLHLHWEKPREIDIPQGEGGHGGGDARMLEDIFVGNENDPLATAAGIDAGVNSIMVGIAANKSIEQKKTIKIDNLLNRNLYK